jgi:hypothetical protein
VGQTDGGGGIVEETNSTTGTTGTGGTGANHAGTGAGFSGDGTIHNGNLNKSFSFTNDGMGGYSNDWATLSVGGFGGGGGAGLLPGGGGGFSGGNISGNWAGSGTAYGGGSYNAGTNQNNTPDTREGHGKVTLIWVGN